MVKRYSGVPVPTSVAEWKGAPGICSIVTGELELFLDMSNEIKSREIHNRLARVEASSDLLQKSMDELRKDMVSLSNGVARLEGKLDHKPHYLKPIIGTAVVGALIAYLAWLGSNVWNHGQVLAVMERARELSKVAASPQTSKTSERIHQILNRVRQNDSTSFPERSLTEAGMVLFASAKDNPAAWKSAKLILDFRSELNAPYLAAFGTPSSVKVLEPTRHKTRVINGMKPPALMQSLEAVAIKDAAIAAEIGEDYNSENQTGPRFLIMRNGALSLDGMRYRHVIFDNCEIYYTGDETQLSDVIFVNCRFFFEQTGKTINLAQKILETDRITYGTM